MTAAIAVDDLPIPIGAGGAMDAAGRLKHALKSIGLVLGTPLAEKNPLKVAALADVPLVLSMARLIIVAFAVVLIRYVALNGIVGWPVATLCIADILALPVVSRLEQLPPERAVELMQQVIGRFGVGAVGPMPLARAGEPSKFDDHRADA